MNFGAFVSPPRRRYPLGAEHVNAQHTTSESELPMKGLSMKTLSECPRQALPLDVRVSSAGVVDDHVEYTCAMHSVVSDTSWSVTYRYSAFHAFKSTVEEVLTCDSTKCSGSCQAIRDYIHACFPKKRVLFSTSPRVVRDREVKLENVLLHLLRCVLLPGSAMKCADARRNLPTHLFEFLGVADARDRRSLLQIFVDNYQTGLHRASFGSTSTAAYSDDWHASCECDGAQCVICLEDIGDNASDDSHHSRSSSSSSTIGSCSRSSSSSSSSSGSCSHSHSHSHKHVEAHDDSAVEDHDHYSDPRDCSADHTGESALEHSAVSCTDNSDDECNIDTIDPSDTTAAAVELPCGHVFHRECVFEWLLFQFHCPLCRSRVGPPAVTSFCRAKNRVQWWLGEFEHDPLRH